MTNEAAALKKPNGTKGKVTRMRQIGIEHIAILFLIE